MDSSILNIQRLRLLQLLWLAEIVVLAMGAKVYLVGGPVLDSLILLVAAIINLSIIYLVYKGQQQLGAILFLLLLTAMILGLLWGSNGIRDNAILALPVILFFSSVIGLKKLVAVLWFIMSANILLIGWLNNAGYLVPKPLNDGLTSAVDLTIILSVSALVSYLLAKDFFTLLSSLKQEMALTQQAHQKLEFQATHDHLTGLHNRAAAERKFGEIVGEIDRHQRKSVAVLFIDLDEFKDINDALGHDMGDAFLKSVSSKLASSIRVNDHIFRIGGDEFLIFVEMEETDDSIISVVEKVKSLLNEGIDVDSSNHIKCSGSIGIVFVPEDAPDYQTAVKRADIAMYHAKDSGKNRYHFYDHEMEQRLIDRYQIQQLLPTAITEKQFFTLFQPIVALDQERSVGAEALVRWQHPEKGTVRPDLFIELLEKTDLIDQLTLQVIEESVELLRGATKINADFIVSVNISPNQLKRSGLCEQLMSAIPGDLLSNIKLEVTESQMISDMEEITRNVQEIRQSGLQFYLDDFGTGYPNLGHLQKLDFDTLKIDRTFTHKIDGELDKQNLVKGIAELGRQLGMHIVSEGVERQEELQTLIDLGINRAQGYYWSKPVEIPQLLERLSQGK